MQRETPDKQLYPSSPTRLKLFSLILMLPFPFEVVTLAENKINSGLQESLQKAREKKEGNSGIPYFTISLLCSRGRG